MSETNQVDYWNNRYKNDSARWDLGHASRPLVEYMLSIPDKSIRILIPGAGYAYEAAWLWKNGFQNVYVVDWSPLTIENFKAKFPAFPTENLICEDFFKVKGEYDLILEQTFYCALPPALRNDYVKKMSELIVQGGKLVGVMFIFPFLEDKGPPWGGSLEEYRKRFGEYFSIEKMENCYNSEPDRQGQEAFVSFTKKGMLN